MNGVLQDLEEELGIRIPRRSLGDIDPWTMTPGYTANERGSILDLNLCGLGLTKFPTNILKCKQVRLLDLGANALTSLPKEIKILRKLTVLNLGENKLTAIPDEIGDLSSLERLILWGNCLTALPETLVNLRHLKIFNAFQNPIEYPPEDILLGGLEAVVAFFSDPESREPLRLKRDSVENSFQPIAIGQSNITTRRLPLVQFDGFLKQIDRDGMTAEARIVLDTAFPRFWPADPNSEEFQKQREAFIERGVNYIFDDLEPPRRFAGCWTLPKKRYFSLCADEHGNDSNTLANELNAYLDPERGGLCLFGDMAFPQVAEHFESSFGLPARTGPYLVFLFIGRPGAVSPVIEALEEIGATPGIGNQNRERVVVAVEVPYTVQRSQIDDVFDLRLPGCQDYIVEEFFKKDTQCLRKSDRRGVERFVETLPVLMNPALGGGAQSDDNGAILQALAAFLRFNGAKALIFPSARSDVLVETKAGHLHHWRGWCLVDYRGTSNPIVSGVVDFSQGWVKKFPKGATVRYATDLQHHGSFEVAGIVSWGRDRVSELEARFLEEQVNKVDPES